MIKKIIRDNNLIRIYINENNKIISHGKRKSKNFYKMYDRELVRIYVTKGRIQIIKYIKKEFDFTLHECMDYVRQMENSVL